MTSETVMPGNVSVWALPGLKYRIEDGIDPLETYICNYFGVDKSFLFGKTRERKSVMARQICMYFLRLRTKMTLLQIGKRYNRDHTTVIHSLQTVNALMFSDPDYKNEIYKLSTRI